MRRTICRFFKAFQSPDFDDFIKGSRIASGAVLAPNAVGVVSGALGSEAYQIVP